MLIVGGGRGAVAAAPRCYCAYSPFLTSRCRSLAVRAVNSRETEGTSSEELRLRSLKQLDEELRRGDDRAALSLVRDLQGQPGGLRCFGAAQQVPQRLYTLDELKLNGIDTSSFLAPVDLTLGSIERNLQIAFALGGVSAWYALDLSQLQLLFITVGLLFVGSVDLIYFNGGVRNLLLDTIGHTLSQKYHNRVIQHEAGHFIIAYLLGVLPKGYTITSLETLNKQGNLNVQAGTAFVDFEFVEEVGSGKVSAKTLDRFSCIALAGVATEYLLYGYSEGGLDDIAKLDGLLKSLGFTQKKADSQSAATADTVWEHFLPSEIDSILSRTAQPPAFASKKELYFHLCNHGIIIDDGRMKFRMERSNGAKIYMLAARALGIIWGDDPQYWQRVAHHDSEFSEVAQLLFVWWLEIGGAISIKNLTPKTKYAAYFIFKLQDDSSGLDLPLHTFVTCGDQDISRCRICLQPRNGRTRQGTNNQIKYPQVREDRWTEIEVGEFYVNGEDILAVAKVLEVKGLWQKSAGAHC